MLAEHKNIFQKYKTVLFLSLLVGFITHLTLLVLQPVVADPVLFLLYWKDASWQLINQGRFGGNLHHFLFGFIKIPALAITARIFYMSICSILFLEIFDVKHRIITYIIGIAFVVHPYVANALMFYSTVTEFGYVCVILVAYIFQKKNINILSVLICTVLNLIAFSFGQTHISLCSTITLFMFIYNVLYQKKNKYKIILFQVLSIMLAGIAYLCIWKVLIIKTNTNIFYGGAEAYSLKNVILSFPKSLKNAYRYLYLYLFCDSILHNSYWHRAILNLFFIITSIISVLVYLQKKIKTFSAKDIIFCIFAIFLIPISLSSIIFIVTKYPFYLLMMQGFVLIIPFCLAIMDFEFVGMPYISKKLLYIASTIAVIISWTFILSNNAGYLFLNQTFITAKNTAGRVLYALENTTGFDYSKRVCFIGQPHTINDSNEYWYRLGKLRNACPGSTFTEIAVWPGIWENSDGWGRYIEYYYGIPLNYLTNGSQDEITQITSTSQFKEAPCFPKKGYIQVINDIFVVKLGDN